MSINTATKTLRELQREMGERWLRDHPVMDPPMGFQLYPEGIGTWDEDPQASGWYLRDSEWETVACFGELADGMDRDLVHAYADDERVVRIELWRNGDDCVWVAVREGADRPN